MKQKQTGLTRELREKIEVLAGEDLRKIFPQIIFRDKMKSVDRFLSAYIKNKTDQFYIKGKGISSLSSFIDPHALIRIDSKAEMIFMKMLHDKGIIFEDHYKIGPYVADFLIDKWLVIEIDGPQHNHRKEYDGKRDKYMEKLGYSVLRIPIWLLSINPEIVLDTIKEKL